MNHSAFIKAAVIAGGMFAPLLGVLGARAIASSHGPAKAHAASAAADPVEPVVPAYVPTVAPGSEPLNEEILRQSAPGEFSTPFYAPKAPLAVPSLAPSDPKRASKLVLTSIMAGREPFAIIDGKLLRVGAKVDEQWSIKGIDHGAGVVILESVDGDTKEIRLHR